MKVETRDVNVVGIGCYAGHGYWKDLN